MPMSWLIPAQAANAVVSAGVCRRNKNHRQPRNPGSLRPDSPGNDGDAKSPSSSGRFLKRHGFIPGQGPQSFRNWQEATAILSHMLVQNRNRALRLWTCRLRVRIMNAHEPFVPPPSQTVHSPTAPHGRGCGRENRRWVMRTLRGRSFRGNAVAQHDDSGAFPSARLLRPAHTAGPATSAERAMCGERLLRRLVERRPIGALGHTGPCDPFGQRHSHGPAWRRPSRACAKQVGDGLRGAVPGAL